LGKEYTQDFYALASTSPQEAIDKYIGDDFQWINPLPNFIPFGGTYRGADGLFKYFTLLDAAIVMSPLHFDTILAENNLVSVIGVEKDTLVKATNKRYSMPFVHILTFKDDGKLSQVREYNDITDMITAFTN